MLAAALAMSAAPMQAESETKFSAALPVWPAGLEKERNIQAVFRATFEAPEGKELSLRLTAASLYRFSVNGAFAGHGPARGGHGFNRVDEYPLTKHLRPGKNELVIEVAGYNCNSYYLLDQPSFLQAEILAGDQLIAATGVEGFETLIDRSRVQKVQRYSFQRTFSEIWRLPRKWEPAESPVGTALPLATRRVPYSTFELRRPTAHLAAGTVEVGELPQSLWKDRSLTLVGPKFAGFPENELETIPSIELQAVRTVASGPAVKEIKLGSNSFHTIDFGTNFTGFIGATVKVREKTRLFFTFDEILTKGDVDWKRMSCVNIISYELEPGTYQIESFEPYTMRYLKLLVLEGDCDFGDLYLRELVNPDAARGTFATSDARFNRIFEAARQTFQQNATDVFMDCPSRERAGWLCDSFFTARVALDLCGDTTVEKNFYENFERSPSFPHIPDGMLPMCFPADHNDGVFIPNWAMWFVLQLEEYAVRSGDRQLVDALRPRVLGLFDYFKPFENSDGLLEKLESWIFVEWSKANGLVQDVNYPTNMIYAAALDSAARLYDMPELAEKAGRMRETIRKQSFDGTFFVDNALRKEDGKLEVTTNRTEACQYYAFYFGVATTESHPELWRTLVEDFGPGRKQTKAHPEIHPANFLIGNVLRLELLSRDGRARQLLDESIGYLLYMADLTGTLWEHDSHVASCNHGFASHAAHVFYRDVLGFHQVDRLKRRIELRFNDLPLDWCEGSMPTADGPLKLRWWKDGEKTAYRLEVPEGWQVEVSNPSGRELQRQGGAISESP